MTTPNINSGLILHAYAKVSAATPPVLSDEVNITGVVRTAEGIWVVTLATEIDDTQRSVLLTPVMGVDVSITKDPAVQTDSTVGVLGFDAVAAAGDIAWEITVFRIASPS